MKNVGFFRDSLSPLAIRRIGLLKPQSAGILSINQTIWFVGLN